MSTKELTDSDIEYLSKFNTEEEIENEIKDEIEKFIKNGNQFENFDAGTSPVLSRAHSWKKVYFMNMLWLQSSNCYNFPKTWSILKSIPGIVMGGILILEPDAEIFPHCSESNVNIRFHLGIDIPAPYPICGIKVDKLEKGWENGKCIAFSDCHLHTVWNRSGKNRTIIVFDILKDEYRNKTLWYCSNYLGALSVRAVFTRIGLGKVAPEWSLKPFFWLFSFIWFVFLPIQNRVFNAFWKDKV